MKLKVLPPTLRKNHHYLILDVKSEVELAINTIGISGTIKSGIDKFIVE